MTQSLKKLNAARERLSLIKGKQRARDRREKQAKRGELGTTDAGLFVAAKARAQVAAKLDEFIEHQINSSAKTKEKWLPHLQQLDTQQSAEIALRGCLDGAGAGYTLNNVVMHLAVSFNSSLMVDVLRRTRKGAGHLAEIAKRTKRKEGTKYSQNEYAMYLAKREIRRQFDQPMNHTKDGYVWDEFDDQTAAKVGGILISAVLAGTDIFEIEKEKQDVNDKHKPRKLVFTPQAQEELRSKNLELDGFESQNGPMFEVPRPWDHELIGPYDNYGNARLVKLVKHMGEDQRALVEKAVANGDMDQCLDALNTLQANPYMVNEYVVEAVEYVKDLSLDGDGSIRVNGFPNFHKATQPERIDKDKLMAMEMDERQEYNREYTAVKKANREADSNVLGINRHLSEAKMILKHAKKHEAVFEGFYLPHQFDFRGRVYHTPEFGHHNTDYIRAMFLFFNKSAITSDNAWLLAIQLANSYGNGVDKLSLQGRVDWVEKHLDPCLAAGSAFEDVDNIWEVIDQSTGEVLEQTTFDFWTNADEPFQFLAACHEYANYCEHGEGYMTGLPIALDATCSGLQILSAIARSKEDGEKVNLVPADKPGDIYTDVMHQVIKDIEEDEKRLTARYAENPEPDQRDLEAARNWLAFGIKRKHCKRATMTYSYSSEQFGFAEQYRSDLMDDITKELRIDAQNGEAKEHPFGKDNGFYAAWYMGCMIYDAIEKVISSAAEGMKTFQNITAICNDNNMHLHYTTPLGFPMVQNYCVIKGTKSGIRMPLWDREAKAFHKESNLKLQTYTKEIKKDKAVRACAPNMVHALDASLLMLTVLKCKERGVTDLMVVHDSFSTTIGNAHTMSVAIRESFVDLFSNHCPFEALMHQTLQRISNKVELPMPGDLDLNDVVKSDYAFS